MRLLDAVQVRVDGRVPVGVAFEVEPGQEVHPLGGLQEAAVRVDRHDLAVLEVLC